MISWHPYDDHDAFAVFQALDVNDFIEASHVRGGPSTHLELFADWRSMRGAWVLSKVLKYANASRPAIAVLALCHTGQAGVGSAAFLSADHSGHRRALALAARDIRDLMPGFCREHGINRVEARNWAGHPNAARFLRLCGFSFETDLAGFGGPGCVTFQQHAFVPQPRKETF